MDGGTFAQVERLTSDLKWGTKESLNKSLFFWKNLGGGGLKPPWPSQLHHPRFIKRSHLPILTHLSLAFHVFGYFSLSTCYETFKPVSFPANLGQKCPYYQDQVLYCITYTIMIPFSLLVIRKRSVYFVKKCSLILYSPSNNNIYCSVVLNTVRKACKFYSEIRQP